VTTGSERARQGPHGSGPGAITPDGCAVEIYRRLPTRGEPELIARVAPPPRSLLELGCGAGRLTHPLLDLGYDVTAVDESAQMLAALRPQVGAVGGRIEDLRLEERFDAVLLASHLVNVPEAHQRGQLLDCRRRHLAPGGVVIIERHPPE
jgi:SAM-dependent methyltransferase